jgi:alcohol dehydrogenase
VDLSDDKLQQAVALGATHIVNAGQPDALEQIRSLSSGGVEFAFEFAGSIRALELAYRITRRGGCTVTAGLPPSTAVLPLPAVSLVAEERTLKGSYIGTCVPSRDIPRYIDLYTQGRLPVNKLLTGRLRLDEINHGFDLLHEGKAIRQVVVFE